MAGNPMLVACSRCVEMFPCRSNAKMWARPKAGADNPGRHVERSRVAPWRRRKAWLLFRCCSGVVAGTARSASCGSRPPYLVSVILVTALWMPALPSLFSLLCALTDQYRPDASFHHDSPLSVRLGIDTASRPLLLCVSFPYGKSAGVPFLILCSSMSLLLFLKSFLLHRVSCPLTLVTLPPPLNFRSLLSLGEI